MPDPLNDVSYLPHWVTDRESFELRTRDDGPSWRCQRPRDWGQVGAGLRAARRRLQALPIERIVTAIDAVARRWGDRDWPARRAAVEAAAAATRFSTAAVAESFDVELANYRAESLRAVLHRELGDPGVLDGYRPEARLGGHTRAIGPAAVLAVFTGNVPGLPALALVRALLVKSPVVAKVAGGEPTFAARFAATLAEEEPAFGDALLCTYWAREEQPILDAALAQVDTVMVYGGDEACRALRARLRPEHRYVEHGHKVSVGLLTEAYLRVHGLERVAAAVARDATVFNGHACIAPVAYVIAADAPVAADFAVVLADALDARARVVPPGELDAADAATLQLTRAGAAWRAAADGPAHDVFAGAGLGYTLVRAPRLVLEGAAGNRSLRLVVVPDGDAAMAEIAPLARYLQNVAVGALPPELERYAERLAGLGACRICAPGRMSEPSMVWRHDGRACVAELVRWCDVEMHAGWSS